MGTNDARGTTPEPKTENEQWRLGTVMAKRLPDGRVLTITPMTFSKFRLNLGTDYCYDDSWWYDSLEGAVSAFMNFDPTKEPEGWYRNPRTGRRRPDGDPAKEYVRL